MNKENEEFMLRMMQMFEKQNEQHQAAMTALVQAMTSKSNDESRADMTPTSSGVSQTQLMNDIGSRVAMFQFDLETEKTFSKWYARHEAAFTVEGKDLEDKSKVSLLMSKMSDEVYEQYSKRICPRKHTEVEFDETVKTLEQMFDIKKSLFSHRFACINIARDDETPVEYTTKVNSMCESAMLQDIDAEGWKVFFWLKGLDASRDKSARTYFIRYVEQKWEKKESVNVNDLCEEWKKLLRQNSVVQEMEQVDKAVRALHTKKDFNRNHKKLWN
uniref:DUF7083 domain-containing protein n=1 Tax=Caenorhabditis japonica TaxID=281687 RepID=A0A8R1E0V4_CAEJA